MTRLFESSFDCKRGSDGMVGELSVGHSSWKLRTDILTVASRLVSTLERLMGMGNPSQTDLLILSTLNILHGILLQLFTLFPLNFIPLFFL